MSFIDFTCLSVKQLRMTIFVQRIKLRYRHGKDNEKGAAEERRRTTKKKAATTRKSTFAIIFVLQKGKAREDGTAPIVARITVNHEMVHFATRMYIHPDRWLPKDYRTAGKSREEKQINDALDELRVLIRRRYDQMLRGEETITAAMLKNAITGLDQSASTLLGVCDRFIEDYTDLLRTKQCCRETYLRYLLTRVPSNQKVNSYLKEIADLCGIDKDLTFHCTRHTFATTVTLANGVPIETVSKMLGHTNIQTTQIYARVIDTKINNDMEALARKLNVRSIIRQTETTAV